MSLSKNLRKSAAARGIVGVAGTPIAFHWSRIFAENAARVVIFEKYLEKISPRGHFLPL